MEMQKLTITIGDKRGCLHASSLVSALQDTLALLKEVNQDINGRSMNWYVAAAQMRSPFSTTFAGEAEQQVVRPFLNGLRQIEQQAAHPAHFSVNALQVAKRLVGLYNDGVAFIEFSAPGEQPVRPTCRLAVNVDDVLARERKRYHVATELEGRLESISVHGSKPNFCIYDPITDKPIECDFKESDLSRIADLIKTKARVRVSGTAEFDPDDKPQLIRVENITPLPQQSELPQIRDLHAAGIDITGGADSVQYIRGLRDAE